MRRRLLAACSLRVEKKGAARGARTAGARIDATAWVWAGGPTSDHFDLYYAANASSPVWTFLTTINPTVGGSQTFSATYTLRTGTLQAVHARFRYNGSAAACGAGAYDDHDDLIFAVIRRIREGGGERLPPFSSVSYRGIGFICSSNFSPKRSCHVLRSSFGSPAIGGSMGSSR